MILNNKNNIVKNTNSINKLPVNIVNLLGEYLDLQDVYNLSKTCKKFYNIFFKNSHYTVKLCYQKFFSLDIEYFHDSGDDKQFLEIKQKKDNWLAMNTNDKQFYKHILQQYNKISDNWKVLGLSIEDKEIQEAFNQMGLKINSILRDPPLPILKLRRENIGQYCTSWLQNDLAEVLYDSSNSQKFMGLNCFDEDNYLKEISQFFKQHKSYFINEVKDWIKNNKNTQIEQNNTNIQYGKNEKEFLELRWYIINDDFENFFQKCNNNQKLFTPETQQDIIERQKLKQKKIAQKKKIQKKTNNLLKMIEEDRKKKGYAPLSDIKNSNNSSNKNNKIEQEVEKSSNDNEDSEMEFEDSSQELPQIELEKQQSMAPQQFQSNFLTKQNNNNNLNLNENSDDEDDLFQLEMPSLQKTTSQMIDLSNKKIQPISLKQKKSSQNSDKSPLKPLAQNIQQGSQIQKIPVLIQFYKNLYYHILNKLKLISKYLEEHQTNYKNGFDLLSEYNLQWGTYVAALHEMEDNLKDFLEVFNGAYEEIFPDYPSFPKISLWRLMGKMWNKNIYQKNELERHMFECFQRILTQRRKENLQFQINLGPVEEKLQKAYYMPSQLEQVSLMMLTSFTKSKKFSMSKNSYVERYDFDHQYFNKNSYQVDQILSNFVEGVLDKSLNEINVHYLGHTQVKVEEPYIQLEERILEDCNKFYQHQYSSIFSSESLKMYWDFLQGDYKYLSKVFKERTLHRIKILQHQSWLEFFHNKVYIMLTNRLQQLDIEGIPFNIEIESGNQLEIEQQQQQQQQEESKQVIFKNMSKSVQLNNKINQDISIKQLKQSNTEFSKKQQERIQKIIEQIMEPALQKYQKNEGLGMDIEEYRNELQIFTVELIQQEIFQIEEQMYFNIQEQFDNLTVENYINEQDQEIEDLNNWRKIPSSLNPMETKFYSLNGNISIEDINKLVIENRQKQNQDNNQTKNQKNDDEISESDTDECSRYSSGSDENKKIMEVTPIQLQKNKSNCLNQQITNNNIQNDENEEEDDDSLPDMCCQLKKQDSQIKQVNNLVQFNKGKDNQIVQNNINKNFQKFQQLEEIKNDDEGENEQENDSSDLDLPDMEQLQFNKQKSTINEIKPIQNQNSQNIFPKKQKNNIQLGNLQKQLSGGSFFDEFNKNQKNKFENKNQFIKFDEEQLPNKKNIINQNTQKIGDILINNNNNFENMFFSQNGSEKNILINNSNLNNNNSNLNQQIKLRQNDDNQDKNYFNKNGNNLIEKKQIDKLNQNNNLLLTNQKDSAKQQNFQLKDKVLNLRESNQSYQTDTTLNLEYSNNNTNLSGSSGTNFESMLSSTNNNTSNDQNFQQNQLYKQQLLQQQKEVQKNKVNYQL